MIKICEYYKICRIRKNCSGAKPYDYNSTISSLSCYRGVNGNFNNKKLILITEFQYKMWEKSDDYNK